MINERLRRLKAGAIDETRKLFSIFLYLFVLLSLFAFYKALILNEQSLIYHQGFALINALALAKVILIGEYFHAGDNLKNRPLIFPILFKSAVFAVLLVCFHIFEEALIGVLHGKTLSQSVSNIGGGRLEGIAGIGLIMFVVLMPFFAFRELDRVIGTQELHSLLFGDEAKGGAALPILPRRWRMAAAALTLLVLGGGWLTWSLRRGTTTHYVTQEVEPGSVLRTMTAVGIVTPAATVPVVARVSGVIQALGCDVKMKVKAGQVCAKIDPRPYQIMVDRNKSNLAEAEARFEMGKAGLARAKAAFEHQEALATRRAMSRKATENLRKIYDQAQVREKREEATVGQLQAALHTAEINLSSTDVVPPVDGVVLSRTVEMGHPTVGGSEAPPLFIIASDPAVVQIEAEVSRTDIGEVAYGDKATFTIESLPNHPFAGKVIQIGQSRSIDEQATTYVVVISASNSDLLLEPGMRAAIRIQSRLRDEG
ncbi:MAG TPA: efflux RND transporter periplasmic adaptor subunit [Methylocella sp.]|jgi:RND family efflux transporter MFP subunit